MTAEPDRHGDEHARGARFDHAVNVVAGGPPAWLRTALREALDHDLGAYPDERPAQEAIAAHHGREPAEVVLLNGGAQGFWLLGPALRPRRPVVVQPQFSEPVRALRAAGCSQRDVVLVEPWHLDPGRVPRDADLVVVGNPTNPTGVLHPPAALRALLAPGRVVVVDEAFLPLTEHPEATLAGERSRGLVVLRSLTKHLAVPGLRVGYALAAPELARRLRDQRPPWSVNALALAACRAAAARPHDHAAAEALAADREALAEGLRRLPGVCVHPASANFVLVSVPGARAIAAGLRERDGIAVRPAWTFPGLGPNALRITVRGGEDDARLLDALGRLLVTAPVGPATF